MPCRPVPCVALAGSKPSPSSVTVNPRCPSGQAKATVAREARAYFATFCSASRMQKYAAASASASLADPS